MSHTVIVKDHDYVYIKRKVFKYTRGGNFRKGDNLRWKKIKHLKLNCSLWCRRCIRVWHIITFSWSLMSHMIVFQKFTSYSGTSLCDIKVLNLRAHIEYLQMLWKHTKSPEHFWSVYIFYIEVVNNFYSCVHTWYNSKP